MEKINYGSVKLNTILGIRQKMIRSVLSLSFFFVLLIVFWGDILIAENITFWENADRLFDQGIILYRNGQFETAKQKFSSMLNTEDFHQRTTAALIMAAKTSEKLNDFELCISYANSLLERFPTSSYTDDAHFCIATCRFKMGDVESALTHLLWVMNNSSNAQLVSKSEEIAGKIIDKEMNVTLLEKLSDEYRHDAAQSFLTLRLARIEYGLGMDKKAAKRLRGLIKIKPKTKYAKAAKELQIIGPRIPQMALKIGVVLPLTGFYSEEAVDLLRGMMYALKSHPPMKRKIELIVRDSEGQTVGAVRAAQSLVNDGRIIAIVGGLESEKTSAIAGVAAAKEVALLAPVATDDGISAIGETIFQLNNDLNTRATKLAEYAMHKLGLRTFATLAVADEYGKAMGDAFASAVDKLGGTIVAQKWYYEGAQDVTRQLVSVRELGFRLALRDSLKKLGLSVTPSRLDSMWRVENIKFMLQNKDKDKDKKDLIKATDVPVRSIDGVFLPIYLEDVEYVVPQFIRQNIQAQLLGGEYWYDAEELRKQRKDVNGIIFTSGHFIYEYEQAYREFRDDFRRKMAASPGNMAIYGYDTMNLIIEAVENGCVSQTDMVSYLNKVEGLVGLKNKITLRNTGRVNSEVNIIKFIDGNLVKLEW